MGNKGAKIDKQLIVKHNQTTALSKIKILLFGGNMGKSHWFNGTFDHKSIHDITFKIDSFSIGDKLPDIDTIIYDTPSNIKCFDKTIQYMAFIDGLILTYNIHEKQSLNHIKKCIYRIKESLQKRTPCLLLGIQESYDNKTNNCVDAAQEFASTFKFFHTQIDIQQDIKATEPFNYLLRSILNQKQTAGSPLDLHEDNDDNDSELKIDFLNINSLKTRERCAHSMNIIGNKKGLNSDDKYQLLYEKYTLKFGKPQQPKYLMSFAKQNG
eukprot:356416_1